MARLRYNVAVSLDGFIARHDGSYDWITEDDSIDFEALFARFDAFLMGRRTFETMLAQGDKNPFRYKARDRVAVVTAAGLANGPDADVTVLRNTAQVVELVREARTRFQRDVWLFGGGALCGCLLTEQAVDTIETAIIPVILGRGIQLVQPPGLGGEETSELVPGWSLHLTASEALKSGILMCKYDVVYSM